MTAALFVSGQAFAIDRSPVEKINNKKLILKKKTMLLPGLLKSVGRGEQIKLVLQLLLQFFQERWDAMGHI